MSENEELKTEEQEREKAPEVEAEIVKEKDKKENNSVKMSSEEEMTKKIIFSLCYVFGILFFLPLIMYKNDSKAMRHANEGLVLLLFSIIGNAVFGILSSFLWVFSIIAGVYSLALFILGIFGIVFVITDQDKELPLLGKIKILK